MAVERDGPQPDPAGPAADEGAGGPGDLDIDPVERLRALAMGPPKLRIYDGRFTIFDCGDNFAQEGNGSADRRAGVRAGQFRREVQDHAAIGAVVLCHPHAVEPVSGPTLQTQVAPDSRGNEARAPVPAELTLLFADDRASPDRIVDVARVVPGAVRPEILHGAAKPDPQLVLPGAQERCHLPATAEEHVLRAAGLAAVEPQSCNRVESVGDELHDLLGQQ